MLALGAGAWHRGAYASTAQPDQAFDAVRIDDAFRAIGGVPTTSDAIVLDVPELSENGAFVPVTVSSTLPGVDEIMLLVGSNPYPMIVRFTIPPGTEPFLATRVKLAQTCSVCAVVRARGGLYCTYRDTTVIVGGCG